MSGGGANRTSSVTCVNSFGNGPAPFRFGSDTVRLGRRHCRSSAVEAPGNERTNITEAPP
jgi:hypothetical protein